VNCEQDPPLPRGGTDVIDRGMRTAGLAVGVSESNSKVDLLPAGDNFVGSSVSANENVPRA
jgi:hypothetical protein